MPDVELSQITNAEVTKDGRLVRLACRGDAGTEFNMLVPLDALNDLIKNLQVLYISANLTAETSRPVTLPTVEFFEPEPVFFVTALGGHVQPETGYVELRVGQEDGQNFQLVLPKTQSRILYDLLLEVFATGDSEKPS